MDKDLASRYKIAGRAVIAGALLICYALARMFASPQVAEEAAVPNVPDVRPLAAVIDDSARPTPAENSEQEIEPPVPEVELEASELYLAEEATPSVGTDPISEAFPSEAAEGGAVGSGDLRTYYAQVENENRELETIQLMAPNASRAERIIRDFRGNPKIVNGPSTEVGW